MRKSKKAKAVPKEWLFDDMPPVEKRVTMKTLSIRIPESLFDEIGREADALSISKSEMVRRRLEMSPVERQALCDEIDDLEAFELMANLLAYARPAEQAA